MADPVVHITNGIPDLGTGNITTLGMTLTDGANATIGATTDGAVVAGAAGTINAHLRSISRDIVNGISLAGGANTIGVVLQGSPPWAANITQFGSAAVVTGTGIGGAGVPRVTVSSDSSMAVTQSGTWNINSVTTLPLPAGAATAAKQPALGTAGVPSADVLTVQGISGGVALPVNGSGGTFPITAASPLAVTQSGTWDIRNVSGTVSLPTGAATSARQILGGAAGSPSAEVGTIQGIAGMTAVKTTISGNGGANLDFAGQNAATATNAVLAGGQFNTSPTTISSGNFSPLQLDASGNLRVNIMAGAGSGGTASTVGAAVPGQGTLALGSVTTAAPSYTTATANSLSLTTTGNLRVDGSSVTQPISGSVSIIGTVPVSGTFWQATQPVSGTVTANQGGAPWTVKPDGTAWAMTTTSANVNVTNTVAVSGTFWQSTQPISGTVTVTQGTAANLNATVSGTVTANLGTIAGVATAANQPTNVSAATTTSGQTGTLSFGAVSTSAPTYVTAQSNPLSLTTAGALRVDNSAVTQPVSGTVTANQGGTWTVQPGNTANTTPWLVTPKGFQDSGGTDITDTVNHALKVNIIAGAGSGGTASTVGGATPTQGTLAMGAVTTSAPVYTTATANSLSLTTGGGLRVDGSAVTQPVSGTFWQATQPVSGTFWQATQPVSGNVGITGTVAATQSGTWTVQPGNTANTTAWLVTGSGGTFPVTGTFWQATQPVSIAATVNVSAAQSGNWTVRNVGNAGGILDAAQNAAAPANELVVGGVYNSVAPTITSGNATQLQTDVNGFLKVNVAAGGASGGTSSSFGATFPTVGTAAGAEYLSAPPSLTSGQMVALQVTSAGSLHTTVDNTVPVTGTFWQTTQPVSGTFWQATQPVSIAATVNVSATQSGSWTTLGQGAVTTAAPTYTTGTNNSLSLNLAGGLRVDGSGVTQPVSGTFWQATQPVSIAAAVTVAQATAANLNATVTGTVNAAQSGTWTVQPGNTANTTPWLTTINQGGNSAVVKAASTAAAATDPSLVVNISPNSPPMAMTQSGAWNVGQSGTWTVQQGTPPWVVTGNYTPATAAPAGSRILASGVAATALPAAATAGNVVDPLFDKNGRLIAVGAIRVLKGVQKTSITVATETTVVTAGSAGVFNDVYAIVVTNKSATSVFVDFRDATAGTIRMTLAAPASDTRGFTVPVDSAMPQAVAANNWTATVSSAVTSIEISMLYTSNN